MWSYDISEGQWFFKARTVSICGYVPASSGGYSLPFHFLQQLISPASEMQWKILSTEHWNWPNKRSQLETIIVCIITCWGAVQKSKSCTYTPLNLPLFRAALLQRLYWLLFSEDLKVLGPPGAMQEKEYAVKKHQPWGRWGAVRKGENLFFCRYRPLLFF